MVVVITPQEVALADCRKCIDVCNQVKVPVARIVKNMSGFVCSDCGYRHPLFSQGGGAWLAAGAKVPLLAQLLLDPLFLQRCDAGELPEGLAENAVISDEMTRVAEAML